MQNPPGPGVYDLPKTFGKEGLQRSFGKKLHLDDIQLRRSMALPGPGDYIHPDKVEDKLTMMSKARHKSNLSIDVASQNTNSRNIHNFSGLSNYSYTINSTKPNPRNQTFLKEDNRFNINQLTINHYYRN